MKTKLKNDRYRNVRGGHARLLLISCQTYNEDICEYQKDGPGNLRRMYVDRIVESSVSIASKALRCKNGHILGMKIIYEKEKRLAFRLFVDSIKKKIIKS